MVHISVQVITMLVGCGLLAKTVTIGAGALALPALTSAGAPDLSRGQVKFCCTSASCPCGGYCTGCQASSPNCYNIQLPTCA